MNKIRFKHEYRKLYHGTGNIAKIVILLDAIKVESSSVSKQLLNYDIDDMLYRLPDCDKYTLLLFKKTEYSIFPAIRKYIEQEYLMYKSKVGQEFDIVIEGSIDTCRTIEYNNTITKDYSSNPNGIIERNIREYYQDKVSESELNRMTNNIPNMDDISRGYWS